MRARPTRGLGFLGLSVCLHAAALAAAALWGVSALQARAPETFTLTWKPASSAPEEEILVAEAPFELDATLEELVASDPGGGELVEPELRASESWGEPLEVTPLDEVEPERLAAVDLSAGHPFLDGGLPGPASGSIGVAAAAGTGGASAGPSTARVGSSTGGEGGGVGASAGDGGGSGGGTGGGIGAGHGVAEARPLDTPRPAYPRLSVRANEEGTVLCRLHVAADGSVAEVEIVESSGHPRLDEAARETLLGWRFDPRREDGLAVATRILHRVTFRLTAG